MVTKLENNSEYLQYISKAMINKFSEWSESNVSYLIEPNNNFQISFVKDEYNIEFIKDKGLLEFKLYFKNEPIRLGYFHYNEILQKIPEQDKKWRFSICTELIDYYMSFIEKYFIRIS